ncbi:MAG: lipid-A-disaccharide synthase [Candidatus Puniceispirillaceae bacterium]
MSEDAFIIAGEPSGDTLAAFLMRSQKDRYQWHGIGGPLMKKEGLICEQDYEALQVIGIGQALRSYPRLKRLFSSLVEAVCQLRPKIIFTIDAKAFSVRFAKAVRQNMKQHGWSAPIIHMVAPTIWAYGAGRRHDFERYFDGLLCLFPMEQSLFDDTKIKARFIGHPAAYDSVLRRQTSQSEVTKLLILPGSRRAEITKLLPVFLEAASDLGAALDIQITIATIEEMKPVIEDIVAGHDCAIVTGKASLQEAFSSHHVMVAASGTVTLEAALCAIPGLVVYQLPPLVATIMKWRFKKADPVLPNIILGEEVYPFLFQKQVDGQKIAHSLKMILSDKRADKRVQKQADNLRSSLRTSDRSFEEAIDSALESMHLS